VKLPAFCLLITSAFIALPLATSAMLQPATITVMAGQNLQAAIDSAQQSDTIVVQSGASFAPIVLRAKTGTGTLTIKTSGTLASGVQVGPANENQIAKIVTPNEYPAIEAEADAHDYKLSGLIATNVGGSVFTPELVLIGSRSSGGPIPIPRLPNHITFDQCWIREATNDTTTPDSPNTTADRGFNISAPFISITNSRIAGFRAYKGSATSGAESSNAILLGGATNFVDINTYHESWFVPIFMQPSSDSANKATLTNPTYDPTSHTWAADFSNVANLAIGDLVAMKVTNGHMPLTNNAHPGEVVVFEVGKVTSVLGNHVSGISWGSFDGNLAGGNPLLQVPDSPGLAQWKGYTNQDILIQRAQFVINFAAAEYVWTHSGGSPTTQPRVTQTRAGNAPKSAVEIKSARNVVIDGATQDGWYTSFVLLTPRNQGNILTSGGAPWAGAFNIRITNNYVKRMQNWDRIYSLVIGGPQLEDNEFSNVRSGPVLIQGNLFASGMEEFFSSMGAADNVSVIHNTYPGSSLTGSSMIKAQGASSNNFVFKDNIVVHNNYGMNNQTGAPNAWLGIIQTGNVIIDNRAANTKIGDGPLNPRYPNDFIAANQAAVGWDASWRLLPTSPYKGKASDGKDPGVDIDQLMAAIGGAIPNPSRSPTPAATPTPTPVPTPSPTRLPTPNPVAPPINQCAIGQWCYWLLKSTHAQHVQVMNNSVAYFFVTRKRDLLTSSTSASGRTPLSVRM
jgi:hypothetical protein